MLSQRNTQLKNSVGIWAFGSNATRFMPGGYHVDAAAEDVVERTKRAVNGLGTLVDSYEYHYPGEINEDNAEKIVAALGPAELYAIPLGVFSDPQFALGSFINPDAALRAKTIQICKGAIDLCQRYSAKFLIWPGGEGYNYPFQTNYDDAWNWFLGGLQEVVEYANARKVPVLLEHKNSEPAMKILMRDMGMSIYVVRKLQSMGTDVSNVKLNMDWQHLIMNGENLAEYAATLAREGLLGHQHANSGWGTFDDDNIVGALRFMETLELAVELQRVGYGSHGERMGFDLFPYTEDQVEAVKLSVLAWEFIDHLAASLDRQALAEAKARKDAVAAYRLVFGVLGMSDDFIKRVYASRKG
ncbi:MAG: TIM barrel protein [Chloroflexi bacterium]|nr:TIM barrel protein [Chloroflexota bacterium]